MHSAMLLAVALSFLYRLARRALQLLRFHGLDALLATGPPTGTSSPGCPGCWPGPGGERPWSGPRPYCIGTRRLPDGVGGDGGQTEGREAEGRQNLDQASELVLRSPRRSSSDVAFSLVYLGLGRLLAL